MIKIINKCLEVSAKAPEVSKMVQKRKNPDENLIFLEKNTKHTVIGPQLLRRTKSDLFHGINNKSFGWKPYSLSKRAISLKNGPKRAKIQIATTYSYKEV